MLLISVTFLCLEGVPLWAIKSKHGNKMQRHFLSNMSEIQFNFELNCFVKDTDKTRLLYMRFPLNSVQEIFNHFFL